MKIALIGFGKMGKEIKRIADSSSDLEIVSISYRNRSEKLDKNGIKHADVAIDFSSPDIVMQSMQEIAHLGIPLVIGTTGWYEELQTVKKLVKVNDIGLVYGQNFSIGANLFFKIITYSA